MSCEHQDHEDCLICTECGQCSESLNDDEVCADCILKAHGEDARCKKCGNAYDPARMKDRICEACAVGSASRRTHKPGMITTTTWRNHGTI